MTQPLLAMTISVLTGFGGQQMWRAAGILSAILVASCDSQIASSLRPQTGCLSSDGQRVVLELIQDSIEERAASDLTDGSGRPLTSRSNVRAAVNMIALTMADVRTAREDPDSTMRFCTASLVGRVPQEMVDGADVSLSLATGGSVAGLAELHGFDRSADGYNSPIDYAVQPTDDGSAVYGEIETPQAIAAFYSELVVGHLMRARLEHAQARQIQDSQDQARLEAEAVGAERSAALAQARTEYDLARQSITAVWEALSPEAQAQLTPNQTAFNRRKTATCNLEAAQTSTDATEREAARITCEARLTAARISELEAWINVGE